MKAIISKQELERVMSSFCSLWRSVHPPEDSMYVVESDDIPFTLEVEVEPVEGNYDSTSSCACFPHSVQTCSSPVCKNKGWTPKENRPEEIEELYSIFSKAHNEVGLSEIGAEKLLDKINQIIRTLNKLTREK